MRTYAREFLEAVESSAVVFSSYEKYIRDKRFEYVKLNGAYERIKASNLDKRISNEEGGRCILIHSREPLLSLDCYVNKMLEPY